MRTLPNHRGEVTEEKDQRGRSILCITCSCCQELSVELTGVSDAAKSDCRALLERHFEDHLRDAEARA